MVYASANFQDNNNAGEASKNEQGSEEDDELTGPHTYISNVRRALTRFTICSLTEKHDKYEPTARNALHPEIKTIDYVPEMKR